MDEEIEGRPWCQHYRGLKASARSYVKDANLQIQVPQSPDFLQNESLDAFKRLYAHYTDQKSVQEEKTGDGNIIQEVRHQMEEAKATYEMMVDISNNIVEAYKDLRKNQ